jgi:predicted nucleic acid-binding protein
MRVLLDNDVVLDFVLEREPFFADAEMIFQHLDNGDIECYVSAITPINVFYTTRKLKDKDIALQAVKDLLVAIEVCRTDKIVLQTAFTLNFGDYEDAVQCANALAENLDAIVTRNVKDYKNSSITIYSPKEFLQILQK